MRNAVLILALILMPPTAQAWEVGFDGPLCTLTHAEDGAAVRLTFDPSVPLYTIAVSGVDPWPVSGVFSMVFDGSQPNTIGTDRHVLSQDRTVLRVSDRGFGNVLDGLQFNTTALAISGDMIVTMSLEGAAPEVEVFRNCGQVPSV